MAFQLDQLHTLAAIDEHGSFDAAAAALRVTPSAVSQRIKALETEAGGVLVTRSKPPRLTPPGESLVAFARRVELLERETLAQLAGQTSISRVSLVANADSLDTWLLPVLATVRGVELEIHREDQDHSVELLRAGLVMGAVTSDPVPVQGCSVSRIGTMTYRPTASRAFAEEWFSRGATVAALEGAPVVVFDRKDDLQDAYLRSRAIESTPPRHFVPGSGAFVRSVELGMGWGMLPDHQAAAGVAAGDLVVFDDSGSVDVSLHWQRWALASPTLDRVGEAILSGLKEDTNS